MSLLTTMGALGGHDTEKSMVSPDAAFATS